jgi:FkbM family methyltransferase
VLTGLNARGGTSVWSKITPPNYLYAKHSTRRVKRDGINYDLDISNVVDHAIYFQLEGDLFESVQAELKKAEVIFDIGANIGSTAMYFAKTSPQATVYAFEPHPQTLQRSLANIKLNPFQNIQFHNVGLGARIDKLKLFEVNSNNPGMNRIIDEVNNFPFVEIEIDTIDNFVGKHEISKIDFIKIDVEGFEFNVIAGGESSLRRHLPTLFIELDDNNLKDNGRSARELVAALYHFGYKNIFRVDNRKIIKVEDDFSNCHFDIVVQR